MMYTYTERCRVNVTEKRRRGGCVCIYTSLTLIHPQGAPPVAAALLIAINVKYLIKFKCSPVG